jgi:hypothetical protein
VRPLGRSVALQVSKAWRGVTGTRLTVETGWSECASVCAFVVLLLGTGLALSVLPAPI